MSLSSIRSRLEAATPGPWTAPNTGHLIDSSAGTVLAMVDKADGLMTPADAAFIAHARQDIPALLRVAEAAARDMENCAGCKADERGYCYRHNETGPTLRDLDALP
mgnify:CR=1 FL=1